MAQETWALKLDAELKEKLQGIIKDDFESSKDFMEQVVSLYELNKLKQGENVLIAEVEELESLTRRINDIFINANAKINTMLQDKDNKASEQVAYKDKLIEKLQSDIIKLEEEKENISSINDSLVNSNNEYLQEVNQFTKSNQTLEDLVAEYKDKNETLTGLLAEYKQDREQNKSLQEQIKILESKLNELNIASKEQAKRILDADHSLREQSNKHENELQELLRKHSDELSTTKQKAEIDANMAILELQQEYQSKIQTLQEKHNAEIEQYQAKYRELLEKMENKKLNKTTAKSKDKITDK